MSEPAEREAVVAEARSWIGTKWRHEGDVKGIGVDCAMLLVRVFVACGLVEDFDPRPYPQHWHLHRSEERYLGWVTRWGHEVTEPGPGDIVVWRVGRTFSHAGIIGAWSAAPPGRRSVIHAYARSRLVEESDLASAASELTDPKRPRRFFSVWGNKGPGSGALPRHGRRRSDQQIGGDMPGACDRTDHLHGERPLAVHDLGGA